MGNLTRPAAIALLWAAPALGPSALAAEPPVAVPAEADADGDGLSDFDEVHKYLTDPAKADTDGDGVPDGDADERREHTYSIRFLLAHLPPAEAVTDAFQDARVVARDEHEVVLEIVAYPLATGDRDIPEFADWRTRYAPLAPWTAATPTCDYDAAMQADLVAALAKDGVDVAALGDRTLVEKATAWALGHAKYQNEGFTTAYVTLEDGKLAVVPGLEPVFRRNQRRKELTLEEQHDAESRGRGMFRQGIRGSCTSSAIYLQTVLRALGVPARQTVSVPPADANSEEQLALLREGLRPSAVRDEIVEGTEALRGAWASHTFDVAFVGGRWRRLNYERLGDGIVSREFQGMMLRVLTYDDRAAAGTSETWGRHAGLRPESARFRSPNPYRLLAVSDRLGAHAKIEMPPAAPPPPDHETLTIVGIGWKPDDADPPGLMEDQGAHILLCRVKEWFDDQDADQYTRFTKAADRRFDLVTEEGRRFAAECRIGYEVGGGLRAVWIAVPTDVAAGIPRGAPLRLVPRNESERTWVVACAPPPLPKEGEPPAQLPPLPFDATHDHAVLTIRAAQWWHDGSVVALHVVEWFGDQGGDQYARFAADSDRRFVLRADGAPDVAAEVLVGSITGADLHACVLRVAREELRPGVAYRLVPRNARAGRAWSVGEGVTLTR